jgi:glycosyltransferase involved in cell wall biosynthesis
VTYPFGHDVNLPGLRIFRCARPPFVHSVRVGPSMAKVPLDLSLTFTALRRVLADRYDALHSHEEGGVIGVALSWLTGKPHLYDMHSSLPQQLTNFAFTRSRLVTAIVAWGERLMIRRSRAIIVICPQLAEVVREVEPAARPVLIENSPGSGDDAVPGSGAGVRREFGLGLETPLVVYTGTFEAYQGLDLLFEAFAHVKRQTGAARLLLAGGQPDQIEDARRGTARLGIDDVTVFAGHRKAEEIPAFLDAATALVSPRSTGINTPLKIYQYLRSGRPIVATRLLTHTQVLDDDVAILAEATPAAFGDGILRALADREGAAAIGRRARQLAETKYSYEAYLEKTRMVYAQMGAEAGAAS